MQENPIINMTGVSNIFSLVVGFPSSSCLGIKLVVSVFLKQWDINIPELQCKDNDVLSGGFFLSGLGSA